jgi:hypothetical protein
VLHPHRFGIGGAQRTHGLIDRREGGGVGARPGGSSRNATPDVTAAGWDDPHTLGAFLDAVRWGTVATADDATLQAPFRPQADRAATPISAKYLARVMRDRYYIGVITYGGEEYPGRTNHWSHASCSPRSKSCSTGGSLSRANGSAGITTTSRALCGAAVATNAASIYSSSSRE